MTDASYVVKIEFIVMPTSYFFYIVYSYGPYINYDIELSWPCVPWIPSAGKKTGFGVVWVGLCMRSD